MGESSKMLESFVGDIVLSNADIPMLKQNGTCIKVLVTERDGEWLTVIDVGGKNTCRVSWYTVFVRLPKESKFNDWSKFSR